MTRPRRKYTWTMAMIADRIVTVAHDAYVRNATSRKVEPARAVARWYPDPPCQTLRNGEG
jgi:hypothetical protein